MYQKIKFFAVSLLLMASMQAVSLPRVITPSCTRSLPQMPQSIKDTWGSLQNYVAQKVSPENRAWAKYHGAHFATGVGAGIAAKWVGALSEAPLLFRKFAYLSTLTVPDSLDKECDFFNKYADKQKDNTGRLTYLIGILCTSKGTVQVLDRSEITQAPSYWS